jgi:hypothetical protein
LTAIIVLVLALTSIGIFLVWNKYTTVSGTGTIRFLSFEGGFHGIIGDDGKNYDPSNLGQEFRVDGLRVRFVLRIMYPFGGVTDSHMWGALVSVINIERLD